MKASAIFRSLAWLLPVTALAETRDPLWVLLSDNADIGLPRFRTGATYASDPVPTSPPESPGNTIASAQGGGLGRLQDAGRPHNSDRTSLGWNATDATVTFDLKRLYRIEAVELLLTSDATPDAIHLECRPDDSSEWTSAGALREFAGTGDFWRMIPLEAPRHAAQVRILMTSRKARSQLREARVWGQLDEADPAPLTPSVNDASSTLSLIDAGGARAVIVLGSHPSPKTTAAARLLQDMLYRMTGVLLPVAKRSPRADLARLLVGPSAAAEADVTIPQTYPKNEHFVLRRTGRDIVVAGNDATPERADESDPATGFHGTMMAVCAFLELHGARFFRWDDVANYLVTPRQSDIRIASLDRTERPAFMRRSMSARTGTYTPSRELWRIWNRIGGVHLAYSHNRFVPVETHRAHPDYFSMIDGQRVDPEAKAAWQLCVSHPEVVRLAGDRAAAQFRDRPSLQSYSLSARDNLGFCECDRCRSQPGNASDRWGAFANAVRMDFDQRYPQFADRKFIFYAYWGLSSPPEHVKLLPGVQVMYVGDGCHAHTWESPHPTCGNHGMLDKLAGWKAASPSEPILIYDWYIPASGTGMRSLQWRNLPWFVHAKPFLDARFWRRQEVPVANIEIDGELELLALHWMPYYMMARALWDPSQSSDTMLEDLCVALYGSAHRSMADMFRLVERSLAESDAHATTWRLPHPEAIYPEARRREIAGLLRHAVEQTEGEARARARVSEVVRLWDGGWSALATLQPPEITMEMYNPAVGK